MKFFKSTRLIIPTLLFIVGCYNLMNPTLQPELTTLWWFLTPFALLIGLFRVYMFYKEKKSEETEN